MKKPQLETLIRGALQKVDKKSVLLTPACIKSFPAFIGYPQYTYVESTLLKSVIFTPIHV